MQRVTITMDEALLAELDGFIETSGAFNRSEAIRDLVRRGLASRSHKQSETDCLAVISYAIDHSVRDLARRIPQGRLDRHDETLANLSIPVDHHSSLDVVVMRGTVPSVTAYADNLFLERGIMHGALHLVPVQSGHHGHSHDEDAESHVHLRVQETF